MERINIQTPPESPTLSTKGFDFVSYAKDNSEHFSAEGVITQRFQLPPKDPYEDVSISVFKPTGSNGLEAGYDDEDVVAGLSMRTNFEIDKILTHRPFTRIRIITVDGGLLKPQRMVIKRGRREWVDLDAYEASSIDSLLRATIFKKKD